MAPKTYKPAKITKPKPKERRCKKNIAVFLSLVGFRDDNPKVTTEILQARLREIKRREAKYVKKIIFKFSGKISCVMTRQDHPTTTSVHAEALPSQSDYDNLTLKDSRNKIQGCQRYDEKSVDSDDQSVKDMMKKDSRTACSEMIKAFEADQSVDKVTKKYSRNVCSEMIKGFEVDQSVDKVTKKDSRNACSLLIKGFEVDQSVDKVTKKDSRNVCSLLIKGFECGQCIDKDMEKDSRNLKDFIKSIGGTKVEFVMEKKLTKTDVTKSQGRLLIPKLQVKNDVFLTEDEENKLRINKESIKVRVLDPERRTFTMNLGIWCMMKSENYVLKSGWNQVVDMNGLKENMIVRVWSFRADQQMWFAVVRV
ncbi:B3 domain-containing protein, DNA-binding pseudobarrel domain protein [Tanacetum coccineum]